jgi:hypothetical protein
MVAILLVGNDDEGRLDTLGMDSGDNIRGSSIFMLDTDRRGPGPCPYADRLKLQLSGFVWYRTEELGSSVTVVGPGPSIEAWSLEGA